VGERADGATLAAPAPATSPTVEIQEPTVEVLERLAVEITANADGKKRPNDRGQIPLRGPGLMLDGRQMAVLVDLHKVHGGAKVHAALLESKGSERPVFFARKVLEGKAPAKTAARPGYGQGLYQSGERPVTCFEDE